MLAQLSRRRLLGSLGTGLTGIALAELLDCDAAANERSASKASPVEIYDTLPKPAHFAPRAKAVIQLFMHGGPSQMDLFDPKPALEKYDGKPFPGVIDVQQPEQSG